MKILRVSDEFFGVCKYAAIVVASVAMALVSVFAVW